MLSSTMLDLLLHFFASFTIGVSFWYFFDRKNKQVLFLCLVFAFLSGFFVDIDHLFDYFMSYGLQWNLQQFLAEDYFTIYNYVFFHGFEYVFLFWLLTFFSEKKTRKLFFMILGCSLFFHLMIDIVLSGASPKSYFIIYRIMTGFRAN